MPATHAHTHTPPIAAVDICAILEEGDDHGHVVDVHSINERQFVVGRRGGLRVCMCACLHRRRGPLGARARLYTVLLPRAAGPKSVPYDQQEPNEYVHVI